MVRVNWVGIVVLVLLAGPLAAGDWPEYRGSNRDGRSTETGLLTEWPEAGPPELYRVPIGPAFSGISVVGERGYTLDSDDEKEYALAFDPESGRTIWRAELGPVFEEYWGNGPRATPTVDGARIYVLSGQGLLLALASNDGEVVWKVDLGEKLGVERPTWGFASSPILFGDQLVLEAGGAGGPTVVAVDKGSGELLWKVHDDETAYAAPLALTLGGVKQLVVNTGHHTIGVDRSGAVLWKHEWGPETTIRPAIPVFVPPDLIFLSASYDVGAVAIRLAGTDEGIEVRELWKNRQMRNHFNASVAVDGLVYGFDNAALRCLDPESGEVKWTKRGRLGKGSLLYADGHFLALTEFGRLLLVEASPEAYREKGSVDALTGRCWTSPSLSNGRLYLRNQSELVAYDLRPKTEEVAK